MSGSLRIMKIWLSIVLVASFACALARPDTIVFNPKKFGPQRIRIGDTFVVRLYGLPSAGYAWSLGKSERPGLRFAGQSVSKGRSPGLGVRQAFEFRFLGSAAGRQELDFVYGRPWELAKGAKPDRTTSIAVIVK
jgi:predicted secreted protein